MFEDKQIDNPFETEQLNGLLDDEMNNSGGGEGDGQNQIHHVLTPLYFTGGGGYSLYSNIGLSAYETVDFTLVSQLINIWMGPAVVGAILSTNGTLAGLMTGISMRSMAPSLLELMFCIGLIGIEIGITSPLWQAVKMNRNNLYTELLEEDITKRIKEDVDPSEQITSIDRNILAGLAPTTLIALYLFNTALPKAGQSDNNLQSI